MIFKRVLESQNIIELLSTVSVDLGVTFKQFDTNSSILVLNTTFDTQPTVFTDEVVYLAYKVNDRALGQLIDITNSRGAKILDTCTYNTTRTGELTVTIDKEVLKYSGDILAELIIVSADNKQRFTSPTLRFKIEPSLVGDTTEAVVGTIVCGEALCGEGVSKKEKVPVKSFLNEKINKFKRS